MSVEWTSVAILPEGVDISYLRMLLEQRAITHRIVDLDGEIRIDVMNAGDVAEAQEIIQALSASRQPSVVGRRSYTKYPSLIKDFPIVYGCLIASLFGAYVVAFRFEWLHWFTYQDFRIVGNDLALFSAEESFRKGEYWRVLTPAILHFGVFHLVFNSLWVWELGRRIEKLIGSARFLGLVVVLAALSNIAQYEYEGPSVFGGMSGVVYGLLGYIWLRHRVAPHPLFAVPPGLIGVMVGWLLICMTGFVDKLIGASIANAAHVGGLVAGMALGFSAGLIARSSDS
ncbi:MAG: rhomboid family intramembrane serine protease [bacterium]